MGGEEEGLGSQQAKSVSAITHERVADMNVCVLLAVTQRRWFERRFHLLPV